VDILCFRYGILPGRLADKLVVKGLVDYVDWGAAGVKDTLEFSVTDSCSSPVRASTKQYWRKNVKI